MKQVLRRFKEFTDSLQNPSPPSPLLATLIGAVGGAIVVFSVLGLDHLRIDDPVGAISVHGTVGIWGLLGRTTDQLGDQLERPTDRNRCDIRFCIRGQPHDMECDSNIGRSAGERR